MFDLSVRVPSLSLVKNEVTVPLPNPREYVITVITFNTYVPCHCRWSLQLNFSSNLHQLEMALTCFCRLKFCIISTSSQTKSMDGLLAFSLVFQCNLENVTLKLTGYISRVTCYSTANVSSRIDMKYSQCVELFGKTLTKITAHIGWSDKQLEAAYVNIYCSRPKINM